MSLIDGLTAFSGSVAAIAAPIIGLFEWAERSLRREPAAEFWRWLRTDRLERQVTSWPQMFVAMFDGLFGPRHLSVRCFLLSAAISFLFVTALAAFWASHATAEQLGVFRRTELRHFLTATVLLNVIPDYISLLQTRLVLQWMCRFSKNSSLVLALIVDLLATMTIAFLLGGISRGVFLELLSKEPFDPTAAFLARPFEMVLLFLSHGVKLEGYQGISIGVFIYSTFWTSLWVWLFALSAIVARSPGLLGGARKWLLHWVDIEATPYRAIGVVATGMALLLYALCAVSVTLLSLIR